MHERLVGDTVSLGGYALDGVTYLVGLDWPDGARVARWTPTWGGGELEAGIPLDDSPLIATDTGGHQAGTREVARLAVVLGLLLDAEGSPTLKDADSL